MSTPNRGFLSRLVATRAWRWIVLYGGVALASTEIVDRLDGAFGPFPPEYSRVLWVLVIGGFPLTAILAWFHGEEGRQRVSPIELGLLSVVAGATLGVCALVLADPVDAAPHLPNPQEYGIAVLPFEHLGHEEDRRRTRGIQAAVQDGLSSVSGLLVIERRAVEALDDSLLTAERASAVLGVKYVLTGTVEWADDRVSTLTSVRLVDGSTGVQVGSWSVPARYDDAEEVFAIQGAIARQVARAVQVELLPGERERLARIPTADAIAMDHYLLGAIEAGSLGVDPEAARAGIAYMERAVERDPTYGEAWARLAAFRAIARAQHRGQFPGITPLAIEEALTAAERYAPSAPETLLARGVYLYLAGRDWPTAERVLSRLTRDHPNWSDGHQMLGIMLRRMDQWPRVIDELEAALTLDPRSLTTLYFASEANYMVGHHEAALRLARLGEELDPSAEPPHWNQVRILLWGLGDTATAVELMERSPHESVRAWMDFVLKTRGDYEGALRFRENHLTGMSLERWDLARLHRAVGNEATMRMWADSARVMIERRLANCPVPGRQSRVGIGMRVCRQIGLAEMAIPLAIDGDTVEALQAIEASREEQRRFRDGYQGTEAVALRGLALIELGRWEEATDEYRLLLSRPSFMHVPMLRIAMETKPLRAAYPPFSAMLDSVEALGPLLERLR